MPGINKDQHAVLETSETRENRDQQPEEVREVTQTDRINRRPINNSGNPSSSGSSNDPEWEDDSDMSSDEGSINSDRITIEDEHDEIEGAEDVQENNTEEVERDGQAEGNNEQDEERQTVKPKRVVRNPQPKLNEETLKGPRGIAALESYFERVKFKGKGYEHQDLNAIMKTYEYWCHRLFPKFPFDTCIERLEKLGTKKAVQVHIRRIRFDLLVEDTPIIDSSDEEANVDGFVDIQSDAINQQFDQLFTTSGPAVGSETLELSEEQLEKIRLNKERAEKLRQERLRKIREKAEVSLDVSSQLPGTSGMNNTDSDG